MATVAVPEFGSVHIPAWVTDLSTFRKWVHSGVLPEKLKVHFIRGEVWVDFHMEELFSHNQVKAAIYLTLTGLIRAERLGLFVPDGMLLTNDPAELGTEPDGMFVSYDAFRTGRVRHTAGRTTGAQATELVGSPDVVIEVVSPSSEDKDTEWLMAQYHNASVPEYWLIDARGEALRFDIFLRGPNEFTAAHRDGEWVASTVFRRSFRLLRGDDPHGYPDYTLEVR